MASPINGWQFIDAPIDAKPLTSWGFDDMVQQVIARRSANPRFKLSTDLKTVQNEVDLQNALRMVAIPNSEGFLVYDGEAQNLPPRQALSRKWANAVGGKSRIATGVNIINDWLGAGGVPVPKEQATTRAIICAACPQNQKGDWTRFFTEPASDFIKRQLAAKNDMSLDTPHDAELGVCAVCSCPLPLKQWTPLAHINDHLSPDVKAKLDSFCWILSESKP